MTLNTEEVSALLGLGPGELSALLAFGLGAIGAFWVARVRAANGSRRSVLWGCCVGALLGAPVHALFGTIRGDRVPDLIGVIVAMFMLVLPISYLGARSGARRVDLR